MKISWWLETVEIGGQILEPASEDEEWKDRRKDSSCKGMRMWKRRKG